MSGTAGTELLSSLLQSAKLFLLPIWTAWAIPQSVRFNARRQKTGLAAVIHASGTQRHFLFGILRQRRHFFDSVKFRRSRLHSAAVL